MRLKNNQFTRFIVVGSLSTVINYGLFFLLLQIFSVNYYLATVVGYVSGLVFGYLLNRRWTFQPVIKRRATELILYTGVYISSLVLSVVVLGVLVKFGLHPLIANIFGICFSTLSNFFGLKYLIFNHASRDRVLKFVPYLGISFWIISAIKLISGTLFGSHYIINGFIPFINYFAATFKNPYEYFNALSVTPFPYPSGMLIFEGLPLIAAKQLLPFDWLNNLNLELFLLRVPILVFDVLIYLSLCSLLPTHGKKILWIYYASPILFFINYFHGQLDVIPTALLMLSIIFLVRKKQLLSFIILGLGIAAKTHVIAALPFYLIYLYRNGVRFSKMASYLVASFLTFVALNPYLLSGGFLNMVFNNPEQQRIFSLAIPFYFRDVTLFVVPAAILLIIYKFGSYKKLNSDSLILAIGLTYTALIVLVPPMPGWYYWALPFLVFFIIKFKKAPIISFAVVNVFFILFFSFTKNSDVFESLRSVVPSFLRGLTLFEILGNKGFIVENIFFTALEISVAVLLAWSYKMGMQSNQIFQKTRERFLIAIAGDSGVGKSTLVDTLKKITGDNKTVVINGDDVHRWERSDPHWQDITHLDPQG
ncbi:MAG: Uncharacterized protein CEN90_316 [Parcubacteria group bacterium Licking1014_17]|nr:MAG: Uncharacterized protein CEN90_316 [Parcubacteria group bacterium Licking1014_17]